MTTTDIEFKRPINVLSTKREVADGQVFAKRAGVRGRIFRAVVEADGEIALMVAFKGAKGATTMYPSELRLSAKTLRELRERLSA